MKTYDLSTYKALRKEGFAAIAAIFYARRAQINVLMGCYYE